MNLIKIFEFKGLFQAGKKMAAPLGYFRRFTNAFKDKSGRIRPFGRGLGGGNQPAGTFVTGPIWDKAVFSALFKDGIFQMIRTTGVNAGFSYYIPGLGQQEVAQVFNLAQPQLMNCNESLSTYRPAGNFTTAVLRGKLFFCEHVDVKDYQLDPLNSWVNYKTFNLMKFDGYQVSRAGLPTPYFHSTPNAGGNARLRVVYMSVGMDGEVVFSNYLEYMVTSGAIANFQLGGSDASFAKHTDAVGMAGQTFPATREKNDALYDFEERGVFGNIANYYNRKYAEISAGTYTSPTGLDMTLGYSNGVLVGDWLLSVNPGPVAGWGYDAFYMKVTAIDTGAGTIRFSPKIRAFNGTTATWEDIDLEFGPPKGWATMTDFIARLVANFGFSNIWCIVSASLNATGTLPYNVCSILPIYWDSYTFTTINTAAMPFARPLLGVISGPLADWYDHTRVKLPFPAVIGITSYTDLLVGFDKNAIYFTDVSLGGSTEMVSGVSNIVPMGAEYGDIVAICGSEEFLLISRERKNYILRGDMTTGNVTITECDEPISGAANAKAVSNAFANKVIFMNATGIYEVDSMGSIKDISAPIKDLFLEKSEDNNLFDPSMMKTKTQIKADTYDCGFVKIALDDVRGFIVILTGEYEPYTLNVVQSNILVYDINDGSWYEWMGESSTTVECIDGKLWSFGTFMHQEDGVLRSEMLLATQWLHMGEPSLEKQVTQLKFYGKFITRAGHPNSTGAVIAQQNDWKKLEPVATDSVFNTYKEYKPKSADDYAHKQRLDSSKPLVTSIIFRDGEDGGGGIEIEGMEIEAAPLQEGVKK